MSRNGLGLEKVVEKERKPLAFSSASGSGMTEATSND